MGRLGKKELLKRVVFLLARDSKAPKYSSPTEEVPQGKKPGARSGLRRKQSSKHTSESTTKASKSQSGHSKKETKSSSAMDTSSSHPSTLILTSFILHSESASGHDASADSTAEADPGISAPSDFVPQQQGMNEGTKNTSYDHIIVGSNPSVLVYKTKSARDGLKTAHTTSGANETSRADDISRKVKLEDLSDIFKDTRSAFFTPDSPTDEPIIVLDESKEDEEVAKDKDTEDTSVPPPLSPKSAQIQELMAQVYLLQSQKEELEQAKVKAEAEVASMKAKPSYTDINQLTELLITELSGDIKELMQHVRDMKIELPGDLVEIPTKLETFTSTISSLSSQVAELKNIQWKLPAEFLNLPSFLPWWTMHQELQAYELIDLLGKDVVTQYYTKKLLFDKYCDKMLKRKKNPKITNCEVLTKKGHITLKIYREDGPDEVVSNLKVSDLHSAEWREVLQACPDKNEKGWKTIFDLVKTRVDQVTQTEQELKIDLNQPLKEQDPLNELIHLANKKRKRTSNLRDHSMSTKKHKSSSSA
ncbi:hypothetical protein Tco_1419902 [Tanacetum coccineum]